MATLMQLCLLLMLLTGCASVQPGASTAVYPVLGPVGDPLYVVRPDLAIHELSEPDRSDPGLLAKAYVATVMQLIHYSEALEQVVEQLQHEYSPFELDPYFNLPGSPHAQQQ